MYNRVLGFFFSQKMSYFVSFSGMILILQDF